MCVVMLCCCLESMFTSGWAVGNFIHDVMELIASCIHVVIGVLCAYLKICRLF